MLMSVGRTMTNVVVSTLPVSIRAVSDSVGSTPASAHAHLGFQRSNSPIAGERFSLSALRLVGFGLLQPDHLRFQTWHSLELSILDIDQRQMSGRPDEMLARHMLAVSIACKRAQHLCSGGVERRTTSEYSTVAELPFGPALPHTGAPRGLLLALRTRPPPHVLFESLQHTNGLRESGNLLTSLVRRYNGRELSRRCT